ncbi:winged helix-turn-helix domain-containing protein [Halodesulfovibrio sp. MK-HDV]|jgi:molybdate transport system regulatory protein|uniref:winged helix-turn-helix domain-containing protein n=1 Tax=unclassified Halodesulfovibrio TaxID=2644657 RepID=UPI00136E2A0A|nr:LysR family transcriptional regulator [Halodesulfovibrio sp. MK-HDV]KAF1073731.1 Molybdenum-pterin-binding protein MopA [Halodesulfovibrio sp. MK-HDV]
MQAKRVKYKLWLEKDGEMLFGSGGAVLLEQIDALGSLSGASKELGMSYRRAWGRLKKLEESIGEDLVTKVGGNKKGYRLTETGRRFITSYREAEKKMDQAAQKIMKDCFNWVR